MSERDDEEKCFVINSSSRFSGSRLCIYETTIHGVPVKVGLLTSVSAEITGEAVRDLLALKTVQGLDILGIEARVSEDLASVLDTLGIRVLTPASRAPPGETRGVTVETFVAQPQITSDAAYKIFTGRIKGQLAGRLLGALSGWKFEFIGHELVYMPLRCYRLMLHKRLVEEELTVEESEFCFELATGSLVTVEDEELIVDQEYYQLGELDENVVAVYEYIGKKGEATLEEISELVGSKQRAEIILQMLIDYGLIRHVGLDSYEPLGPEYPRTSPLSVLQRIGALVPGEPPKCSRILGPGINVSLLDRIVSVWGSIRAITDLYFPIYIGVFRKRRKGEKKGEGGNGIDVAILIDAIWGKRMEDFEELIASSPLVNFVDIIISEIVSSSKAGETRECVPTASQPAEASQR